MVTNARTGLAIKVINIFSLLSDNLGVVGHDKKLDKDLCCNTCTEQLPLHRPVGDQMFQETNKLSLCERRMRMLSYVAQGLSAAAERLQQFVTVLSSVALSDQARRCHLSRNNGGQSWGKTHFSTCPVESRTTFYPPYRSARSMWLIFYSTRWIIKQDWETVFAIQYLRATH